MQDSGKKSEQLKSMSIIADKYFYKTLAPCLVSFTLDT
jgi:hypothetical protein